MFRMTMNVVLGRSGSASWRVSVSLVVVFFQFSVVFCWVFLNGLGSGQRFVEVNAVSMRRIYWHSVSYVSYHLFTVSILVMWWPFLVAFQWRRRWYHDMGRVTTMLWCQWQCHGMVRSMRHVVPKSRTGHRVVKCHDSNQKKCEGHCGVHVFDWWLRGSW